MPKREVEIKKSFGRMAGDMILNGYIKNTGGYDEYQRIRKVLGKAPASKPQPFSRTIKGTVDADSLYEVMQEHAELNTEEARVYTQEFYFAVHKAWLAKTGRGLNEFEIRVFEDRCLELKSRGSHANELDLIDDLVLGHADFLSEEDWECRELIKVVQEDVSSRLVRRLCRGGEIRLKMQAQALWTKKYDGDPDEQ